MAPEKKKSSTRSPIPKKKNERKTMKKQPQTEVTNIPISRKRYMEELMPEDDLDARKRQQLQVDIYGEHLRPQQSMSAINHLESVDILAQSKASSKPTKPQRPSNPFFGKISKTVPVNLNRTSTHRGPTTQSPLKNKAVSSDSDSDSDSGIDNDQSIVTKEPKQEESLQTHIKYHLETHWGISWKWVRRSFLSISYLITIVSLFNMIYFLASLIGGVDLPVPLIHFNALRDALTDSNFGFPALANIYNALYFLIPFLSLAMLGLIGTNLPYQVMMPLFHKYKGFLSGLRSRQKCIAGKPVNYLESGRGAASGYDGKPTVLLIHDAFGSSHDWEDMVCALGTQFHVLAPDLPGHGSHCVKSDEEELNEDAMAKFLSCFKADAIGVTRVHHVVGMGFGAGVALKYASQESVVDYVASVTMLAPFAVEPVSEQFQDMFEDSELLVSKMANPTICRTTLHQLTATTAWKPNFYFMAKSAEWRVNAECREAMIHVLSDTHSKGMVYSSIEQEASGLALHLLFGEQDMVAKNFGPVQEIGALKVANCNLQFTSFPNLGHDMLHETSNSVETVARAVSSFIVKQHKQFTKQNSH